MKKNTFINLVFNKKTGDSRTILDYTYDGSVWDAELYNCVLIGQNSEYAPVFIFNSSGSTGKLNLANCLIIKTGNIGGGHPGYPGTWKNCAFQKSIDNVSSQLVELITSKRKCYS